ncbi:hypothetical protein FKW77_002012 [Venturia effusa]|uniref:Uncharacterized protein n=1 Tax=Venturia effusa TaxID=50376 RepID=A0A517LRG1_9PEZI|nr:hypothetical protein FKW77_002012 [Venturia effusa]
MESLSHASDALLAQDQHQQQVTQESPQPDPNPDLASEVQDQQHQQHQQLRRVENDPTPQHQPTAAQEVGVLQQSGSLFRASRIRMPEITSLSRSNTGPVHISPVAIQERIAHLNRRRLRRLARRRLADTDVYEDATATPRPAISGWYASHRHLTVLQPIPWLASASSSTPNIFVIRQ